VKAQPGFGQAVLQGNDELAQVGTFPHGGGFGAHLLHGAFGREVAVLFVQLAAELFEFVDELGFGLSIVAHG